MDDIDVFRYEVLRQRMELVLPAILAELRIHKQKRTHWIWWVFPTEKLGTSEPLTDDFFVKTKVSLDTMALLVKNPPKCWQLVMELLCDLSTEQGIAYVIPENDYGRIKHFIHLVHAVWEDVPEWLRKTTVCLEELLVVFSSNAALLARYARKLGISQPWTPTKWAMAAAGLVLASGYYVHKTRKQHQRR